MELFHALNRGVDKRKIFLDNQDHARFVHDLYEFNDVVSAANTHRRSLDPTDEMFDFVNRTSERKPIVDIHAWCLMGNHYHLLLSDKIDGGILLFLRRLNVGYANYFNKKYKRLGTLFQGRTKKVPITNDRHFLHILNYIHCNPLDVLKGAGTWRQAKIARSARALKHLETYRWSSCLDYCGTKNFPSIITKDLFASVFKDYKKELREYLRSIELDGVKELLLE